MSIQFEVAFNFPVAPDILYHAWLDSDKHAAMTGGDADVNANVGETFEAWDGYITGTNLELVAPTRIVQVWRTSEFGEDEADSRLEILFEAQNGGTEITIKHSNLPEHGMQYEQGWFDSYFVPMLEHFEPE